MRHTRLGRSGLQLSPLTLGTLGWGSDITDDAARLITEKFVSAGGRSFSTAYGYGEGASEETLGRLVGEVVARDEVVITTKAGISRASGERVVDTSRGTLLRQLDTSLSRLRTDYVDLWMVHTWSDLTPVEETLSALEFAVTSGRARYVGVSNYSGWQLAHAQALSQQARTPLVANEVQYSLLRRDVEHEVVPAAQHLGVGLLAWSPLARGVLTGKYRHTVPADSRGARRPDLLEDYLGIGGRAVVEATHTAAQGLGVTPAQVALAWVLSRPAVSSALIGARTPGQLTALLQSVDLALPHQVLDALNDVSAPDQRSSVS